MGGDVFTEEQKAIGGLLGEAFQVWRGEPSEAILERGSRDPVEYRAEKYPMLHGMIEGTPFGTGGWKGYVQQIQDDPADVALELMAPAMKGLGVAARGARSVRRFAGDPFGIAGALDDVNLITGRTTAQQIARSSVSLRALDEAGNVLQMGTGTYVGPRQIATASHVPFRGAQGEVLRPHSIEYEVLGGAGQRGTISGVLELDAQRDIAILEALGTESVDYVDIARGLDAGQHQAVLSRAGVYTGQVTGGVYQDVTTGGRLAETTLRARETVSGAGMFIDESTIGGAYLGELGERGIYTPGADIQDLLGKAQGRSAVSVADIDAATHVDMLQREGLSFRAGTRRQKFIALWV